MSRADGQHPASHIGADAEIRELLLPLLSPEPAGPSAESSAVQELSGEQLDAVLARIVWARLVEPGDALAGALIATLGAGEALDLVAAGEVSPGAVEALRAAGSLDVSQKELAGAFKRWRLRLNREATLSDLKRGVATGMRVIAPDGELWPRALDDLGPHAPLLLWVRGDPTLLSRPSLAIVGARACTGYGSNITAELAQSVCDAGVTVVSGAAYGIDAVAHRTALAVGAPTIAVLAGGADIYYPAAHEQLLDSIAAAGAVCSEMVPGSAPTRWRFLQRNRSIAALSRATLVTEAGVRSGSLNTAGHAAELARDLGAVPGPVTSATSAGCHRLIREYGAALVTNGVEVREFLGIDDSALFELASEDDARQPALHQRVLDALPLRGGRDLIDVARIAGVDSDEAQNALAELELLGSVEARDTAESGERRWSLRRK
ncbi:MAG: DNA-processing protein DprA [Leucobacter sp.]